VGGQLAPRLGGVPAGGAQELVQLLLAAARAQLRTERSLHLVRGATKS